MLILLVFALLFGMGVESILVWLRDTAITAPRYSSNLHEVILYFPEFISIQEQLPESISIKYMISDEMHGLGYQVWGLSFFLPYKISDINVGQSQANAFISQFG